MSEQDLDRWVADELGAAPPDFRRWFLQTYRRLAPKVADPRELARRLLTQAR